MAQLQFESNLPVWALSVQGDVRIREEGGMFGGGAVPPMGNFPFASPPVNILHADQKLFLNFNWKCEGFIPNFLPANGHWHLTVLFEKMGPGEGPSNVYKRVPAAGEALMTTTTNTESIEIPEDVLAALAPAGDVGAQVYRVVVTMIWHTPANVATPIAGFADLGLIQVYQD